MTSTASTSSPTGSFDLNAYEEQLDRKRKRENCKRAHQVLVELIQNELIQDGYYSTEGDAQVTSSEAGNPTPRLNVETHKRTSESTETDNSIYLSTPEYESTNPADPPSQSLSVGVTHRIRSAPRVVLSALYQIPLKIVKVFLTALWSYKRFIVWFALIFLVSWFIFHVWVSLSLNICHLPGISQLSLCISSADPLPFVKLNVTETLVSANDNLTSIVEHVALMHAFPELLFGLQWTMANLSADMRTVSHYPETRRNLLLEFRGYRSTSGGIYHAIKTLFSGIYDDVGLVLTFTYKTIEQLQQLRNITGGQKKTHLPNFILELVRQPSRPVIGTRIPLNFEHHLDRLLPKLKTKINAGDHLIVDFEELLRHLDGIQVIANNDRDHYKAEHVSTSNSLISKLWRWIGYILRKTEPPENIPNPDEKLAQFRPIIVQGSQSIEYVLSKYRILHMDLKRLADRMKQHERWAYELSPQELVHDLRLGVKGLTQATEEWIQLLVDDYMFLRLNPNAEQELSPLTRKIEAEARKKQVREE